MSDFRRELDERLTVADAEVIVAAEAVRAITEDLYEEHPWLRLPGPEQATRDAQRRQQ